MCSASAVIAQRDVHRACRRTYNARERSGPMLIAKTRPDVWVGPKPGAGPSRVIAHAAAEIARFTAQGDRLVLAGCHSVAIPARGKEAPNGTEPSPWCVQGVEAHHTADHPMAYRRPSLSPLVLTSLVSDYEGS